MDLRTPELDCLVILVIKDKSTNLLKNEKFSIGVLTTSSDNFLCFKVIKILYIIRNFVIGCWIRWARLLIIPIFNIVLSKWKFIFGNLTLITELEASSVDFSELFSTAVSSFSKFSKIFVIWSKISPDFDPVVAWFDVGLKIMRSTYVLHNT